MLLTLAEQGGCIAGPRLNADRQRHLLHRLPQVAGDIDGERLQGRDVESVKAMMGPARSRGLCEIEQTG